MTSQILKPTAYIKTLWWVETEDVSLTGSSTLLTISWLKKMRFLIDIGLFQWWEKIAEYNEKVLKEVKKLDYIIITHAHMDHIWRLPLLVKNGFKWKIIMTNMTKDLAFSMLEDYVNLTKNKIDDFKRNKKQKWEKLRRALKIVNLASKENKNEKNTKSLEKELEKMSLEQAKNLLEKNNISSQEDIQKFLDLEKAPELLYDMKDIFATFEQIETLEIWEELQFAWDSIEKYSDDLIYDILEKKDFSIKYVSWFVKKNITSVLDKDYKKVVSLTKENKKIKLSLEKAFKLGREKDKKLLEKYHIKTKLDLKNIEYFEVYKLKKDLENALKLWNKDLLDNYCIESQEDIDFLIKSCEDDYKMKYRKEDIDKLKKSLLISRWNNKKIIDKINLKFLDASHIEWSIQALFSITTKKIDNILNNYQKNFIDKKETNILFTWDLWLKPEIVKNKKIDFIQSESTYAWKENPPTREKALKKLLLEIKSTNGKTLIPTFSLQRTQEITNMILKELSNYFSLKEKYEKYKKSNKADFQEFLELKNKLTEKEKLLKNLSEFIIDSPLWKKITEVYIKHLPEKYKFLNKYFQKEIFEKEITKFLKQWEYKNLYTEKTKKRKDVILSSSWMLQWWAVLNHLKEIVSNEKAKIIFVWYQAKWTLWNKILSWEKTIEINWELFDVKCDFVQVKWFSSHIWWDDLKDFLNFQNYSKWATIYLNHWWEWRKQLKEELSDLTKKWIKTELAELWKEVKIKL